MQNQGNRETHQDVLIPVVNPPSPEQGNRSINPIDDPLNAGHQEIARVSVKIPPFWRSNPALWFKQVESQFITSGIVADPTKFHTVVGSIDASILSEVSDIIINPPESNMYETLKRSIQERFMDSEEKRLKRLIREIEIGDKKPSTLLREMSSLAANKVSEEVLKSLWMQRLPKQTQVILSVSSESLNKLAQMADKIADTAEPWDINAIASSSSEGSSSSKIRNLEMKIDELTKKIEAMTTGSRSRSKSRSRSSNNSKGKPLCWFHYKFREQARKCVKPCSFPTNFSSEN
ncbi:uncharacterized protein LOC142235848 [Haematobia irritans]|uniref:uncharacterized protein LOC142235848 n=1 Tax=Haematobia irritans TaxID=7368 RepID=UPI003F4F8040